MTTTDAMELPPELLATDGRVVYFPVRHHSPAAARAVRALIRGGGFAHVLIEGPADFNDRLGELFLPHVLPIAIYSHLRTADGPRRGVYYPFCIYSPEWQALGAAREAGARVAFIDLPYADIADEDRRANRYADAELRGSIYVQMVAKRLGVEGLDAVWDTLFEIERNLPPEEYLRRAHGLCGRIRLLDGSLAGGSHADQRREHFMAARIRSTLDTSTGRVLVVTGGYHSLALFLRVNGDNPEPQKLPLDDAVAPAPPTAPSDPSPAAEERGIALTPYSYQRLDALTGYDAGMPNPGFYDRLWHDREPGGRNAGASYRGLLFEVARMLRERKQRVSSADLIAAETCAQALARLRAHAEVWRTDLVDGLTGALLKDELAAGSTHPLLYAIHEVMRGKARGQLAAGTALPSLVLDMKAQLAALELVPEVARRDVRLDLLVPADRAKTALLHRLRLLAVAGFAKTSGTDFVARGEMAEVWESWALAWSPDFDATAIEAARYGPTVADAAVARLTEDAGRIGRSAEKAAVLLLDAALADLHPLAVELHHRVASVIRQDGEFLSVARALSHLLYLYRYDEVLGAHGRGDLGAVLSETFARALWLLEILGQLGGGELDVLDGVRTLVETFDRCEALAGISREAFTDVLTRVQADGSQLPMVRGAALGALWTLHAADAAQVRTAMKLFADPMKLGDFLTGLFGLAREAVQRHRELLLAVDEVLCGYSADDFLAALPALRLAFTYFTPREKHHLAMNLLEAVAAPAASDGIPSAPPPTIDLTVNPEEAARAMAIEARIFAAVERYGLRGVPA
jgi:hypothetical protein